MIFKNFSESFYSLLNLNFSLLKFSRLNLTLILLALFFCIPVVIVCGSLFFPAKDIWAHLIDTVLTDYIFNSLALLIGVGFFSLLLGVIPAWLVTMYQFPMSHPITYVNARLYYCL